MRLRNKKTGEILGLGSLIIKNPNRINCESIINYDSLAELNEEWEDYEDRPYIIDMWEDGYICDVKFGVELEAIERAKECGLYFETKEEAEKAVEKLKAWKRLKDKGFRFILDGETEMPMFVYSGANGEKCITSAEESKQCRNDIKLLFGGEE